MKLIPTSITPVTITLYRGIPFDNKYAEHTFLYPFLYRKTNGTTEQVGFSQNNPERFIELENNGTYVYPRTIKTGTYNFAFGNGLVTSVVMELTGDEINSNYMKVVSGYDKYYYFITGITQKNECTYLLDLELDVIMTFGYEFMQSIKGKPVQVERKHCRRKIVNKSVPHEGRKSWINPICFNQESTFSQFKSNVIKEFTPLEFADFVYNNVVDYNAIMEKMMWIYVIYNDSTIEVEGKKIVYKENGIEYPYQVLAFPTKECYLETVETTPRLINFKPKDTIDEYIIGNNKVLKIIISPFPPFKGGTAISALERGTANSIVFELYNHYYDSGAAGEVLAFTTDVNDGGSKFVLLKTIDHNGYLPFMLTGYGGAFNYKPIEDYFDVSSPTIRSGKDKGEMKLQIEPFKTMVMSSYYGSENIIHTQYLYLKYIETGWDTLTPYTIVSSNPECNSYYDNVKMVDYDDVHAKRGLSSSVAYNYPTSASAENIYNTTAKNQYENGRMVSALTNGLKVVSGIGGLVVGGVMGKVAGAIGIASGVVGEIANLTEWSAKMQDLKNTPDSYSFSGSSLSYDIAMGLTGNSNTLLPYIITYGTTEHEEKVASDFLYWYGYEYNAEATFNDIINQEYDYMFNRQVFNYIKIREDITTKIVGPDMPLTIAKKFNEIFNNGIILWTFLCFDLDDIATDNYNPFDYFQKEIYCNAELIQDNL